jgi:hypothetical protein
MAAPGRKKKVVRKKAARTQKPKAAKRRSAPTMTPDRPAREYLRTMVTSPELAYRTAEKALRKWRKKLLKIEGVLSVDLGMKMKQGHSTHEFAICVYVEEKRRASNLPSSQRIPEQCDGVPTDVLTCRFKLAAATSPAKPEGGDKIRAPGGLFGTLGFGVLNAADNRDRYLTCTHVVSNSNSIGAPVDMKDDAGNSIGTVFATQGVDWEYSRRLDCALITPPNPGFARVTIPRAGALDPFIMRRVTPADMTQGRLVWKWGAATGQTFGSIVSIDANPPLVDGTIAENQIKVKSSSPSLPFALDGDSGSILVVEDEAVGLIRAVSTDQAYVIACPLRRKGGTGVADKLNLFL